MPEKGKQVTRMLMYVSLIIIQEASHGNRSLLASVGLTQPQLGQSRGLSVSGTGHLQAPAGLPRDVLRFPNGADGFVLNICIKSIIPCMCQRTCNSEAATSVQVGRLARPLPQNCTFWLINVVRHCNRNHLTHLVTVLLLSSRSVHKSCEDGAVRQEPGNILPPFSSLGQDGFGAISGRRGIQ